MEVGRERFHPGVSQREMESNRQKKKKIKNEVIVY